MINTFRAYRWENIAPNTTVGVYLHGFAPNMFVTYCITPFTVNRPGVTPRAELRTGSVQQHVDGTYAREAYVTNQSISHGGAPFLYIDLNVLISTLEN